MTIYHADKERAAEPRPKRKQKANTPTQRTLAWGHARGYVMAITEHWNPFAKVRQDLFGCIDLVALTPEGIVGIQTTTIANHGARRTKALGSPKMGAWCAAGGIFWIVSWGDGPVPRFEVLIVPVHATIHVPHDD
jgi:hypothetical protein